MSCVGSWQLSAWHQVSGSRGHRPHWSLVTQADSVTRNCGWQNQFSGSSQHLLSEQFQHFLESASSSVILNFNSNNDRSHSFHTDSVVSGLVVWLVFNILHFNRIGTSHLCD